MNKVAIIIVNYNGLNDTCACIQSIPKKDNYKIIVVDNASKTDEVKIIKNKFEYVHVISSDSNLGFAGGNNLGIKYALENDYDYIMLLNNDTVIEKKMIDELLKYADNNNITVPKMCYYSNPDTVWYAGGYIDKIKGLAIHYGYKMNEEKFNERVKCNFATGCCMLIHKSIFKKIGLLDEKYFMYCEDTDFSIRLDQNKIAILYVPTAKLLHKVSVSTGGENSPMSIYYGTRNRFIYLKQYKKYFCFTAYIYTYVTRYIKILVNIMKRNNNYRIYLQAINDYKKGIVGKKD